MTDGNNLQWTENPPSSPGWYWYISKWERAGEKPEICEVFMEHGILKGRFTSGLCCSLKRIGPRKWAGPIPYPAGTSVMDKETIRDLTEKDGQPW